MERNPRFPSINGKGETLRASTSHGHTRDTGYTLWMC
ncbi:hypothetical protein C4K12_2187 [Pseudomonas chlororaphis subsp. aureofaciens]|nr:hypothetical protein C4K12_2187 [Pseudomonas chlororaphis subsp. aureofaciens]